MSRERAELDRRAGAGVRVLLVDDHAVVRHGLRALLHGVDDFEVVGEAEDGREAIRRARDLEPDLILMDIHLPRLDGAAAAREILAARPATRIIALSGFEIDDRLLYALRAGVLGYLPKSASRAEIVRAVRAVAGGDPSIPADVTRKLLAYVDARGSRGVLSGREIEVLREITTGASNRRIGERLGISEATVRTHLSNIFGKLGISNRVEAALYALRGGLVSLDR